MKLIVLGFPVSSQNSPNLADPRLLPNPDRMSSSAARSPYLIDEFLINAVDHHVATSVENHVTCSVQLVLGDSSIRGDHRELELCDSATRMRIRHLYTSVGHRVSIYVKDLARHFASGRGTENEHDGVNALFPRFMLSYEGISRVWYSVLLYISTVRTFTVN